MDEDGLQGHHSVAVVGMPSMNCSHMSISCPAGDVFRERWVDDCVLNFLARKQQQQAAQAVAEQQQATLVQQQQQAAQLAAAAVQQQQKQQAPAAAATQQAPAGVAAGAVL